jgi:hypothetical protein
MREEAVEKERDKHLNTIRPVIPTKPEWRVKEKLDAPAPKTFDNDMDLLDDDEAPLIKDGCPTPTGMDINMCSRYRPSSRVMRTRLLRCVSPQGGHVREA